MIHDAPNSLAVTDAAAAVVAVAPRVTLTDIEAKIVSRFDVTGQEAAAAVINGSGLRPGQADVPPLSVATLGLLSICILVLRNGYTIIGKSAPASADNFDREIGRRFAYEDAIRQLRPLMWFALCDRLSPVPEPPPASPPS